MTAKAFLLEECKNVRVLLDKTLRFDYGLDGSFDFYEECSTRLDVLTKYISTTNETNFPVLAMWAQGVNDLSKLICRIERSSIGEYSWPFVEELKAIASSICTEDTLANPNSPLKVYVLADGGLDKYEIVPEQKRPSYAKKRLLTIIFPKTLKHFVLLHSILGHEIGHAIWQCTKHERTLRNDVRDHLTHETGAFESKEITADYIFSNTAPPIVASSLAPLIGLGVTAANLFTTYASWNAWVEELLCDVIGLITFGPAFIGATCSLLYSMDLTGGGVGKRHPLVAWRINLLRRGARLLGHDIIPDGDTPVTRAMQKFWTNIDSFVKPEPWFNVLADEEYLAALNGAEKLLAGYPPATYRPPAASSMSKLFEKIANLTPPIAFEISDTDEPVCARVDFRDILYVGWIFSSSDEGADVPFALVNKLCEHAIMQQRAISIALQDVA